MPSRRPDVPPTERSRAARRAAFAGAVAGFALLTAAPPSAAQLPRPEPFGGRGPSPSIPAAPPAVVSAAAVAGEELEIADVRIRGNTTIPAAAILQKLKSRPGRPLDSMTVREDVRTLYGTKWFSSIKPEVRQGPAGAVVVFTVRELPILKSVTYRGCRKVHRDQLANVTGLKPGSPYSVTLNRDAARRIEEHYREKGHLHATVTLQRGGSPDERDAVFVIQEGPKVRLGNVRLEGNEYFSDGKLMTQLEGKGGLFWTAVHTFIGQFDPQLIPNDKAALLDYYRGLGFFDITITHRVEYNDSKSRANVIYTIDEGPRYRVASISYEGNRSIDSNTLATDRELDRNEPFNNRLLQKDLTEMNKRFGAQGRLLTKINPRIEFREEPGVVDLRYEIAEDKVRYIRHVNVEVQGDHPHTKKSVAINAMLVRPGDLADPDLIRKSRSRVGGQPAFEPNVDMRVRPVEGGAGARGISATEFNPRGQSPAPGTVGFTGAPAWGPAPSAVPSAVRPATRVRRAASPLRPPFVPAPQPVIVLPQSPNPFATEPVAPLIPQAQVQQSAGVRTADAAVAQGGPPGGTVVPQSYPPPGVYDPLLPTSPLGDPFAGNRGPLPPFQEELPGFVDIDIAASEARTGRIMIGGAVNSSSGLVGQITLQEDNFDLFRPPRSFQDIMNGTAFRGGGQRFRLEAVPGDQVSRYLVSLTDPFIFDTDYSFGVSGFYFNRFYESWTEQRLGGRLNLGRQLSPFWSVLGTTRIENVKIFNPSVPTPPSLQEVLGSNTLFTLGGSVRYDSRDRAILPGEGTYAEVAFEQGVGDFNYPQFDADVWRYFTLYQRPDGTGLHVLSLNGKIGITGADTPIFERYFAGGYQTIRGFDFRGVGPVENGVFVGGEFQLLGSVQYRFPLLANDAVQGVVFTDFGTVEPEVQIEDFRVAVGFGLRVSLPQAFGPAPLAFDFGFPVAQADTDDEQVFSFSVGVQR